MAHKVDIVQKDRQYGLLVLGSAKTGKEEWVEGDIWGESPGFYRTIYEPREEWALPPSYDSIQKLAMPGWLLEFYLVSSQGQIGLFYIHSRHFSVPQVPASFRSHGYLEFEEQNFRGIYQAGQGDDHVIGGFLVLPQHKQLDLEPDGRKFCFHVTLDGKQGILSGHGYWGRKPIYDDIVPLGREDESDICVARVGDEFELIAFHPLRSPEPYLDRDMPALLQTRNWRRCRRRALELIESTAAIAELKQRWGIREKRFLFF